MELTKNGNGCIFLRKNKAADTIAKIFTRTNNIFISGLLKKWKRKACITFGLL